MPPRFRATVIRRRRRGRAVSLRPAPIALQLDSAQVAAHWSLPPAACCWVRAIHRPSLTPGRMTAVVAASAERRGVTLVDEISLSSSSTALRSQRAATAALATRFVVTIVSFINTFAMTAGCWAGCAAARPGGANRKAGANLYSSHRIAQHAALACFLPLAGQVEAGARSFASAATTSSRRLRRWGCRCRFRPTARSSPGSTARATQATAGPSASG